MQGLISQKGLKQCLEGEPRQSICILEQLVDSTSDRVLYYTEILLYTVSRQDNKVNCINHILFIEQMRE